MRWLLYGLLISVGALLVVAVAAVLYVMKQRRLRPDEPPEAGIGGRVATVAEPVAELETLPGTSSKEEA